MEKKVILILVVITVLSHNAFSHDVEWLAFATGGGDPKRQS